MGGGAVRGEASARHLRQPTFADAEFARRTEVSGRRLALGLCTR
jgi:hypothetical protein